MSLQATPFIWMDGQAKEVIHFYETVLEAKILFTQTFGESPEVPDDSMAEADKTRLAHSVLKIGESDLFVADVFPGTPWQGGNQVTICLSTVDAKKTQQLYNRLAEEGQVKLPLQRVHFSPAYGEVTDKYGVTWQLFTKRQ